MAALRAAYDLGSGATKLCLARVAPAVVPGELPSLEVLFEEEAEVLLGESYKTSDDSTIDDATCAKLVTVVERFERIVSEHAAACGAPVRRAGVATAVYREATNGPALQALLEERFNIRSSVISQSEEGRLGFLTALHKAGGGAPPPVAQMLSWDSGGSSFQLSLGACGGADATTAMPRVFEGAWGSSKVVYALARTIQQKPPESPGTPLSVNPCTAADWATLVAAVAASLSPPDWLQAAVAAHRDRPVAAVGGPTSAFRVAALAVGRGECVTAAEVQQAAAGLCGCSDAEVGARGLPQPQMAVAKLGLVYAVMTACGIQCFTYFPTTGNTAGMLLSEKYWA